MSNKSDRKTTWQRFIAPVAGVLAAVAVIGLFNIQYLMAQIMYRVNSSTHISVTADTVKAQIQEKPEQAKQVAPDPRVIIPGIGVDAPVIYGMNSVNERDVQVALRSGVLHFGGTPLPGQPGNGVYVGHSSGAPWVAGSYKFVFTALENTQLNDVFYLNHDGKQYAYKVVSKKVVNPRDTSVLNGTDKPTATLITCTPVGTDYNRLVILGEQIHPQPATGEAKKPAAQTTVLPGN